MVKRIRTNYSKTWEFEAGSQFQIMIVAAITFEIVGFEPPERYYPGYHGNLEITEISAAAYTSNGIDFRRNDKPEYFELLDLYLWAKYSECETLNNDLRESIQWSN